MNLKKAPSYETFKKLVIDNPGEKLYRVSPSLVRTISQRTWTYAKDRGIRIVPREGAHAGRPQRYDEKERQKIRGSELTAKELSDSWNIPLRTVYFIRAGN